MFSCKRVVLSLVMNLIIVAATIGVVVSYFCGNDGEYHIPPSFRFCLFTTDSNILCMLTALILAVFEIRFLRKGKPVPRLALIMKFFGSSAVALTFAVVVLFLGPSTDFVTMVFGGTSIYMHFAGPLLGVGSFCFVENAFRLEKKLLIPAIIPTAIYAAVYITMVVFIGSENGGWYDFYGFNIGGFWYISCLAIILLSLGLAAVLRLLHNKISKDPIVSNKTEPEPEKP